MKNRKRFGAIAVTAAMIATLSVPAFAATTYDRIETVELNVSANLDAGDNDLNLDITSNTYGCEVIDFEVTNAPDDDWWDAGDRPKVTIELEVTDPDEYRFATSWSKSDVTVDLEGTTVSSVSDSSSRRLKVKLTLPKMEYDEAVLEEGLEIEYADWDLANGVAEWAENSYAKRYEVKLYRNGVSVGGTKKTSDTDYDFSEYFTRRGDYYFEVRAVHSDDYKGSWYEAEEVYVDSDEADDIRSSGGSSNSSSSSGSSSGGTSAGGPGVSNAEGAWLRNDIGWWWCNPDRTYPAAMWKYINNKWYYFNDAGYCVLSQWVQTNGIWYYCGPDGDMWTNRWTPDGYYVNANGVWVQ